MGIIHITGRLKKQPRKPGWAKAQAEYEAWLKSVSSMSSGISATKSIKVVKPDGPKAQMLTGTCDGVYPVHSARYFRDSGTKKVPRPELQYRDDPEMLERELKARERKFNVAPAYNKGADQLVTEEELQNLLSSNKRRS
jgi:hypothetical protein